MGRLKPQDLIFQYYGFAPHGQQGAHFVRIVPIYNVARHSVGNGEVEIERQEKNIRSVATAVYTQRTTSRWLLLRALTTFLP